MTQNDATQNKYRPDDIGRDLAAITPEQRQENVRLTWEGEQASAVAEPHKVPQVERAGETPEQLRRERDGLLNLIAVLWQDNCRHVGNYHLTALHNVNRIRGEMAALGLPILSDAKPHPLLGAAWQLHRLAVEASRTDSTAKAVRAARDELISECLKLGGED